MVRIPLTAVLITVIIPTVMFASMAFHLGKQMLGMSADACDSNWVLVDIVRV